MQESHRGGEVEEICPRIRNKEEENCCNPGFIPKPVVFEWLPVAMASITSSRRA